MEGYIPASNVALPVALLTLNMALVIFERGSSLSVKGVDILVRVEKGLSSISVKRAYSHDQGINNLLSVY